MHVATTYDGLNQKIYVNGVLQKRCSLDWNTIDSGLFAIGAHTLAGSDFLGNIDDVAIWNIDLTADEIATIYNRQSAKYVGVYTSPIFDSTKPSNAWKRFKWKTTKPFGKELLGTADVNRQALSTDAETTTDYSQITNTSLTDQLKVLWRMDDQNLLGTNNVVSDDSGNGNNGHGTLGTTFNVPGKLSSAIFFDGDSGGIINGPNISSQMTGDYSYGLWVNTFVNVLSKMFFRVINGADEIKLDHSGGFTCGAKTTGSTNLLNYTDPIMLNQWYYLVCVIDNVNKIQSFYVNGKLIGSNPMSVSIPWPNSNLKLGESFLGRLDEFAIWGRTLSSTEILDIYRRGSNQIHHEIRTCSTPTCAENPVWLGLNSTYWRPFSEIQNNSTINEVGDPQGIVLHTPPSLLFNLFPNLTLPSNQYFQYRTTLTGYDNSTNCNYGSGGTFCSPELKSAEIVP